MKPLDKTKSPSNPATISPLSIVKMLWIQRWTAVAIWIIVSALVFLAVSRLKPLYKAEVLVFVDSQKIPDRFVTSTVDSDLGDSLALISQEILSRTRLMTIIDMFGLYKQERKTKTDEEVVQKMRDDITVKVERGSGGGKMGAFRLGYQGGDPVVVAQVTNELAQLYVSENLRSREDQAEGTVQFLQSQLNQAQHSLSEQEAKVSLFKQQHNGVLPEQENSLLTTLGNLRVQLQGSQDELNRAEAQKAMIETSLSAEELSRAALLQRLQPKSTNSVAPLMASTEKVPQTKSEALEEQLRDLLRRYTPEHPEVQALRAELAATRRDEEKAAAAMARAAKLSQSVTDSSSIQEKAAGVTPELLAENQRIAMLQTQLQTVKREIATQTQARQQVLEQIASVEERVNRLPLVEQQMASLTRDYETSKEHYKSLLDKELAARIATQLERSQKSERFTVMDPARVPQKPFKPKRLVFDLIGSLGGLLFGALVGIGLEWRKKRLMGEWELPSGIPILGRVPFIEIKSENVAFDRAHAAWLIAIAGAWLSHILLTKGLFV